ncbi:TetR/AcrR family transcriptional regulator [Chitinophaga nivalis]|uniref:TetR/AcrR family transcriptional regulator n=1 Tax=Chitinophaga nivalis TaxID=2991709 RepID=A0ABT3IUW9_9BACT|nr:TetR/AcrR family transcriptional regulator [Chitinophaga nivalis]MCW3462541.1 TetR/AcrR family transcriptional regulator [Chitinophaga nivalis]MCW3487768.1 TetR/AcrR family transcriptional regulator [Chitinophaga nivalis]
MIVKDRIMETALRMFKTYGVKGVTMFDIARDCGVSKKTVYEHFIDKQTLIDEGVQQLLNNHITFFQECLQSTENAIEELVRNMRYIVNIAKTLNPVLLYEIQKYHPDTWRSVEKFQTDCILHSIKENLKRGIAEGLYREHLQIDIIARMRQLQLEAAYDPIQYPADQYDLRAVMDQLTAHFIYGIATIKGHELVNQYLHIKEEE